MLLLSLSLLPFLCVLCASVLCALCVILFFPAVPHLFSSFSLKLPASPGAIQTYATAIPIAPAVHLPTSTPPIAAAPIPSTFRPDRQTPAKTKPASPSRSTHAPA